MQAALQLSNKSPRGTALAALAAGIALGGTVLAPPPTSGKVSFMPLPQSSISTSDTRALSFLGSTTSSETNHINKSEISSFSADEFMAYLIKTSEKVVDEFNFLSFDIDETIKYITHEWPSWIFNDNGIANNLIENFDDFLEDAPPWDLAINEITDSQKAIAELRSWSFLNANWDDEGAEAPNKTSLSNAVNFIYALNAGFNSPEPMLHPNGRAGLFWEEDELYADLEFYDDGRITYFIKTDKDKLRGYTIFDGITLPKVFDSFLT